MAATPNIALAPRSGSRAADVVADVYGVQDWGHGYFIVDERGNLAVTPQGDRSRSIVLLDLVDRVAEEGVAPPFLVRFPQILDDRLRVIHRAFQRAIKEFDYPKSHLGVYPIKTNQKAEVVQRLASSGERYDYGLEAGSKAELLAALSVPLSDRSLVICNGLKDELYLRLALLSAKLGRNTFVVAEDPAELLSALELGEKLDIEPQIGIRVKLYSRGSGKWEESGGEFAKFGMSTVALVRSIELLRERGMGRLLKMLHFHIGSQITDIRRAKQAFKEAARVYAKARLMGCDVEYLNVGGGLGVDYDGSKTASEFSVNYSVQEFANDVIYTIKDVCESEGVPPPTVVNEAGRAMVAYHSLLIADVKRVIRPGADVEYDLDAIESEVEPIRELLDITRELHAKNFREYYHDALQDREDLNKLFELGYVSLEDKAKGEWLFWRICRQVVKLSRGMKQRPGEFEDLEKLLAAKYICNFSMFQSLPDFWAFDQLFPILPIHRLNELPTERGVLCDITCDSDGSVDKFIDVRDVKEALELHSFDPRRPYYLAFCLIGAYQETLGDLHNLFGEVAEVSALVDPDGRVTLEELQRGDAVREVLEYTGHDADEIRNALVRLLARQVEKGRIDSEEEHELLATASLVLDDYTYLG